MLKVGLKLWSINTDILDQAFNAVLNDVFQFIELTPIPETEITPFINPDISYIIHMPPDKYGMNLADPSKNNLNNQFLNLCTDWADQLQARYIIFHPGFGAHDAVAEFLEDLNDERTLLENMPRYGIHQEDMVGYLPEKLGDLMAGKFGFCFDFSHATKTAISIGVDFHQFLMDFLPLKPKVIHISDSHLDNDIDEHLNIGQGEYEWGFLADCILKCENPLITLETPRVPGSLEPNIAEAEFIRNLLV